MFVCCVKMNEGLEGVYQKAVDVMSRKRRCALGGEGVKNVAAA